jgi:hypothetical protein
MPHSVLNPQHDQPLTVPIHARVAAKDDLGFVTLVGGCAIRCRRNSSYRVQVCLSASKALLRRVGTRGLIG